ncbi:MAG TPA: hypothetical protein VFM01_05525 [Nakamurella sp.]|nr:hypothetical protein [Nakamurella sp.]
MWQVWYLTGGLPVLLDLALQVDLLGRETPTKAATEALFHLSKEALRRRTIDEVWRERAATAPKMLASVLMSEPVVDALRKELRRQTGHNADAAALASLVKDTVIRPDLT